jgi:hypothetical protein
MTAEPLATASAIDLSQMDAEGLRASRDIFDKVQVSGQL